MYTSARKGLVTLLLCLIIFLTRSVWVYTGKCLWVISDFENTDICRHSVLTDNTRSWYGISAYPKISGQKETWVWILRFIDSIPHQDDFSISNIPEDSKHSAAPDSQQPSPVTINSVRFKGVKTVSLEEACLKKILESNATSSLRATDVPAYECDHQDCFGEKQKLTLRPPESLPIADDIVILHAQITDMYDLERIAVSLHSRTRVLITAITVLPSKVEHREWEDNLALPLYDFFHRLYFSYNWIPQTSTLTVSCSNYEQRLKHGCMLSVIWTRWNRTQSLQYIPPAGNGSSEMELQRLSSFLNRPTSEACHVSQKIGGHWAANSFVDGQYTLCLDDLRGALTATSPTGGCLVYSFGVSDDWEFDDTMHEAGCDVHSFDPSIHKASHKRNNRHWFHNLGLASATSTVNPKWRMTTYKKIRRKLVHERKTVNVLKMDIEGAEWTFLKGVMKDGSLEMVDQFVIEIHSWKMGHEGKGIREKAMLLHYLQKMGFVLFSTRVKYYGLDLRSLDYSNTILGRETERFLYELSFVKRHTCESHQ